MKRLLTLIGIALLASVGCTPSQNGNEGKNEVEKVEITLYEISGIYYGNQYSESEDSYNYSLVLSSHADVYDFVSGYVDIRENSQYLFLDLYSTTPSSNYGLTFKAPNGVYTLDSKDTTAPGTTGASYTNIVLTNETESTEVFFTSGTVTVTDDTIEAILEGKDGKQYIVSGVNKVVDNTDSYGNGALPGQYSSLTSDLNIPFTGYTEVYYEMWYDYFVIGKHCWMLYVDDLSSEDEVMLMLLADPEKERPEGTFPISSDLTAEVILPGYVDGYGESNGSWYWKLENFYDIIGKAPIKSGEVTISFGEEKMCTVVIDVVDDLGNKITGTCTGKFVTDEGLSISKLSTASRFMQTKKAIAPRKEKRNYTLKR